MVFYNMSKGIRNHKADDSLKWAQIHKHHQAKWKEWNEEQISYFLREANQSHLK